MATVLNRIRALEQSLTQSERKVAGVLRAHQEPFRLAIGELARQSRVSEASVVRFYRRLGYRSYQELKVALAQEVTEVSSRAIYEEVSPGDSPMAVLTKVFDQSMEALRTTLVMVDPRALESAAALVSTAKRLFFMGAGASGVIAQDGAHKFLRLGGQAVALVDSHIQAITAAHMVPDDVIVTISHSGESVEVLDAAGLARERGARLIAITGFGNASLCKVANVVLLTAAREVNYRSDAMASRLVQLALLDALYVMAVLRRGPDAIEAVNRSRLAVARRKT